MNLGKSELASHFKHCTAVMSSSKLLFNVL
jgi:hypothetical protein